MANRIQIRYGLQTPNKEHLNPFELGYCIQDQTLYIGLPNLKEDNFIDESSCILNIGGLNNFIFDINNEWTWRYRKDSSINNDKIYMVLKPTSNETATLTLNNNLIVNNHVNTKTETITSSLIAGNYICDFSNGIVFKTGGN